MDAASPLYQDNELKIDYLPNSSEEEHLLYIKEKGEDTSFIIPRGVLRELARTSRGGIERKISAFNENILYQLRKNGIGIDGLHIALCQAYAEEEDRIREFMKQQVE